MIVNKNVYVADEEYRVWESTAVSDPWPESCFLKETDSVLYPLTYPYWFA